MLCYKLRTELLRFRDGGMPANAERSSWVINGNKTLPACILVNLLQWSGIAYHCWTARG